MSSQSIWRRRVALMAVLGLVVAVPVTLLIRDGEDEEDGAPHPTQPAATVQAPPAVGPGETDTGLDVSYSVPRDWEASKEASAIRLSSPDSSAEIVIAAPAPATDADLLLEETLDAFESSYDDVEIAPGSGRKIGGLDAKGAVVKAAQGDGKLSVLVAVAPGDERAYLVEVFTTADVSPESLRQAQAALNSLELKG